MLFRSPVIGSIDHIEQKRKWLEDTTQQMLRKGKVLGLAASSEGTANSGVQVAIQSSPLHSELAATAKLLERSETEIVRLAVSRNVGKPISTDDLGYDVQYNDHFTLQSMEQIIKELQMLSKVDGIRQTPKVLQLMMRKVVDSLAREKTPGHVEALKEIEEFNADGVNDLEPLGDDK